MFIKLVLAELKKLFLEGVSSWYCRHWIYLKVIMVVDKFFFQSVKPIGSISSSHIVSSYGLYTGFLGCLIFVILLRLLPFANSIFHFYIS